MFPRSIASALHAAAATFPVVVLLGARQVGKTTLARSVFAAHRYLDLEDPRTADRFRQDPRFELDAGTDAGAGLILDEAQAVPQVFAALRGAVDARRTTAGRFIVLGSAQPALVRGVSESLAGRGDDACALRILREAMPVALPRQTRRARCVHQRARAY